MKVIANYKGTKIIGDNVREVIFEIKRLTDKAEHVNHIIRR